MADLSTPDIENESLFARFRELARDIACLKRVVVAYSGGIDSTLVAFVAAHALGPSARIVMATSPLLGDDEEASARQTAALCGFTLETIPHPGWNSDAVRKNTSQRCYACKSALFAALHELDADATILCGDNAEDLSTSRPGLVAAQEARVKSPLAEHGFKKNEIREIARLLNLDNADKPSRPCLATRFPQDCLLQDSLLDAVRASERILAQESELKVFRVRCDNVGNARIEISVEELALLDEPAKQDIVGSLEGLGFSSVSLDANGYRET